MLGLLTWRASSFVNMLLAKSLESASFHFLAYFSAILCAIHTQVIPNDPPSMLINLITMTLPHVTVM